MSTLQPIVGQVDDGVLPEQDLQAEIRRLRETLLDITDAYSRLQAQHDVLENFCFALEQEHDKARSASEDRWDLADQVQRLEAQHDVLENFCFALEQEHDQARRALQRTRAELHESYRVHELKKQQDDILANVRQGILTITADGTINAEYSRQAVRIFGREDLAGLSFYELFAADQPIVARLQRLLDVLFHAPHAGPDMIERLNPLGEYTYVPSVGQERDPRYLSFSFSRMSRCANCDGIARAGDPDKVLLVVDDKTVEHRLNEALQRKSAEQAAKIERLYEILMLPADTFTDFMIECEEAVGAVERHVASLPAEGLQRRRVLNECLRRVHTVKGNARALNLLAIADACHRLESVVSALRDGDESDAGTNGAQVAVEIGNLQAELADGSSLFANIMDVRRTLGDRQAGGIEQIERTLRRLIDVETENRGQKVKLEWICSTEKSVPSAVVVRLRNCLIQMVRNALFHGFEPAEDRIALGKPGEGVVSVRVQQEGAGDLIVSCRDDGAGLDIELLRRAALSGGVCSATQLEQMGDSEVAQLVFIPGLTTSRDVTQGAGRGFGMDIVKHELASISGAISVRTKRDCFTEFSVRVPLNKHS